MPVLDMGQVAAMRVGVGGEVCEGLPGVGAEPAQLGGERCPRVAVHPAALSPRVAYPVSPVRWRHRECSFPGAWAPRWAGDLLVVVRVAGGSVAGAADRTPDARRATRWASPRPAHGVALAYRAARRARCVTRVPSSWPASFPAPVRAIRRSPRPRLGGEAIHVGHLRGDHTSTSTLTSGRTRMTGRAGRSSSGSRWPTTR